MLTSRAQADAAAAPKARAGRRGSRTQVEDLITVIIPARNEERLIGQCLEAVLAQDHSALQVVVVDGASTDGTAAVVRRYMERDPRVELVSNPRAITPTQLNAGLRAARARWMVRIDAHATVPPQYVSRAVAHLRTGTWGGVGGRVDPVGVTPAGRAIAVAMSSRFGIGNSIHHYGKDPRPADHVPFPAYPVELVRQLGGWDEDLPTNQDFEFDFRLGKAGYRLLYDPTLSIRYHGQQSIRGVFRQFRRYGRGKASVALLHPGSIRARHAVAPAVVAVLGVAAVAAVFGRPKLALAAVAPYGAGLAAASALSAGKLEDGAARSRLPAAFSAMHVGWGVGFWEGLVANLGTRLRRRR